MYCPKCGKENPNDGRFCRKCGIKLSGMPVQTRGGFDPDSSKSHKKNKKKKKDTWESAMGSLFTGIAFLIISGVLAYQPMGTGWWFWMLIPAFAMIGSGVAAILRIKYGENEQAVKGNEPEQAQIATEEVGALPPKQTTFASDYVAPKYDTGKVTAPPSVVEQTTRNLEMDTEGKTTKLPKKK